MSENQSTVYPVTVQPDGTGRVQMIHESGVTLPFDVILSPSKVEEWQNGTDEQRRASLSTVAYNVAMLASPVGEVLYSGLVPFPVESEQDIVAAYNFLLITASEDIPDHVLEWVDRPSFSTADLN